MFFFPNRTALPSGIFYEIHQIDHCLHCPIGTGCLHAAQKSWLHHTAVWYLKSTYHKCADLWSRLAGSSGSWGRENKIWGRYRHWRRTDGTGRIFQQKGIPAWQLSNTMAVHATALRWTLESTIKDRHGTDSTNWTCSRALRTQRTWKNTWPMNCSAEAKYLHR